MSLELAAPYDGTAVVHDGVAGTGTVSAGVITGGGPMSVYSEVGVGVHFEAIVLLGSSVIPCVLVAFRYFIRWTMASPWDTKGLGRNGRIHALQK